MVHKEKAKTKTVAKRKAHSEPSRVKVGGE
jgi:hypothetical protein